MKKLKYVFCLLVVVLLVGCSKGYKEGEYTGSAVDSYGNQNNTATAKVTIDKDGKITSVFLDTTYTKDGLATTKKTLKEEYGMLSPYGSSVGEWYEQVEKLEQAVVEHQGIDFLKLDDEGKTDAVSGCTIKIDAMYEALSKALDSAKK